MTKKKDSPLCIKTLGCVLNIVLDAKMAMMAMTMDTVSRMHRYFIFCINDILDNIWKQFDFFFGWSCLRF